jgi:translocation and assembly module TamB
VTGQVLIPRGTIDIQGKRFTIERGEATFTGDPSNPTIFLSATWDAPDGSHVVAQYTGPVQNGKLTLQSDPPHTQDEIVSLLVFGSADGPVSSGGSAASGAATTAVGTGASLATQPINKAISQLTRLDIKTRVDSGSASGSRSEVEVQLARAVSVQIAYVLGLPPPGTDPDRTWLTLLFHFTARWSLDFTMGDHGSSIVEMLWHYRY